MSVKSELKELTLAGGGVLTPKAVVDFAKAHPRSALHRRFDWNVRKAAMKHWLAQARDVIQCYVEILDTGDGKPRTTRAYVSVKTGRKRNRNAREYRTTRSVLSQRETRVQLVLDQLQMIHGILASYHLPELRPVSSLVIRMKKSFEQRVAAFTSKRIRKNVVRLPRAANSNRRARAVA